MLPYDPILPRPHRTRACRPSRLIIAWSRVQRSSRIVRDVTGMMAIGVILLDACARVERVTKPISQQVEREQDEEQDEPRCECDVRRERQVVPAAREDRAPLRRGGWHADPEKAERGGKLDTGGHPERGLADQRATEDRHDE